MIALTFRELLNVARKAGVRRALTRSEAAAIIGTSGDAAGVELSDGRRLVCTVSQDFGGSDVTPADPPTVAFYLVERTR